MAKKRIFRVIGIVQSTDNMTALKIAGKYYSSSVARRLIMGPRKQDKNLPSSEVKFFRIQVDFTDIDVAKDCRDELSCIFVKDKSDF